MPAPRPLAVIVQCVRNPVQEGGEARGGGRGGADGACIGQPLAAGSGIEYAYGHCAMRAESGTRRRRGAAAEDGPCLPWGLGVMPSSPAFGSVREMTSLFQYY
ncbi:hypothetical protein TRIUR3_22123 [Triticum urartu]|uniref:Uncharacterized protein n=1 Tax=Triticum urartu TaxID=4572 RepID=M7Z5N2_TRIUA|nr:hypothetical protein TRIUR3_22123 [Triticum urartu]